MSETAHASFEQSAFYLGIEVKKVPKTNQFKLDIVETKKQINTDTICVVASAPDYAFGNYDPIPQIAALAV